MNHPIAADRLPPQSVEAELQVLGACMLDNSVIDDVRSILAPEEMWRDDHRKILEAIFDLNAKGKPADAIMVAEVLTRRGEFEGIGGYDLFSYIFNATPHAASAAHHAAIVRDKAVKRRLIESARATIQSVYREAEPSEDLLAAAERRVMEIGGSRNRVEPITMADAMGREIDRMDRLSRGEVLGVQTPFKELNDMTGGLLDTNLIVVAARPGKGKSSLALSFAEYCAFDSGVPCLFVSEEMSSAELAGRSLASRSGVDHQKIRTGQGLNYTQMRSISQAWDIARSASPFFIADSGGMTCSDVGALTRRLIARHGVKVVFVDYLQLLKSEHRGRENRQEAVARIARDLKCLAMNLQIPVVALSQLNRELEKREDSRPRLSDLRESGAIENDANVVLMLHQPDRQSNAVECIVEKNRNGPTGDVQLIFRKHLMRFEEPPEPDPIDNGYF